MAITNGYATLADVKAALRITDTIDDVLLENSINSASRMIDQYCNRYFYSTASGEVRYFKALDAFNCWIDDCQVVTEVRTAQSNPITFNQVWASTDFQTIPANTYANGAYQPITGLIAIYNYFFPTWQESNLVKVTGTWGWATILNLLSLRLLFKRADSINALNRLWVLRVLAILALCVLVRVWMAMFSNLLSLIV